MSTTPPPTSETIERQLAPGVALAGSSIIVKEVVPALAKAIVFLGGVHQAMFGIPLVITSGNDGTHAPGSKHYTNQAVDIRARDLTQGAEIAFCVVLSWAGPEMGFRVFDERADQGAPHWHIEV